MEGRSNWIKTPTMETEVDFKVAIRCKCDLVAVSKAEHGYGFDRWLDEAHYQLPRNVDDSNDRSMKSIVRVEEEANQPRFRSKQKMTLLELHAKSCIQALLDGQALSVLVCRGYGAQVQNQ
ncbi:hypothetical protein TIFTF001_035477 [Ficus carica]|uniref:Uncharacterized protein n=1 Tax=Ficus carica TaxID=3494 RepID=A0AA88E213_FICCA|nr:hypothetical protein TIFTF001_035477 [Ficus carica]